jgi:predicted nuclease of predicted toxin-antitoxin system
LKLKLDENLGRRCIDILQAAGHDVTTVASQSMTSATDHDLIEACAKEGRALVTLDLDFSNPFIFPPERHAGVAVLRLPSNPTYDSLRAVVRTLADALKRETLSGQLWSVEAGRIRVYERQKTVDEGEQHQ